MLEAAVVFAAQGTPFIQAGEEMLRTKVKDDGTFDSNSYQSSDAINSIKWGRVDSYQEVYEYYKVLMAFRKEHSGLRMTTTEEMNANITFVEGTDSNVIAYSIASGVNGETSDEIFVIYNPNREETKLNLPEGEWKVYINGSRAGTEILDTVAKQVVVEPISCMVLVLDSTEFEENQSAIEVGASNTEVTPAEVDSTEVTLDEVEENDNLTLKIVGGVIIGLLITAGIILSQKQKKVKK